MENNENTCTSPCCCDCVSPCGGHVYDSLPVGTWPPQCCNECGIQVGTTNVYDSNKQKWQDEINQELYNISGSMSSLIAGNGIKLEKDGQQVSEITDSGTISIDETNVVTVNGNQDIHVNSINNIDNITETLLAANTALQQENVIAGNGIIVTPADNGVVISNSGETPYSNLTNKPQINGVELAENKTADELGLLSKSTFATLSTQYTCSSASNAPVKVITTDASVISGVRYLVTMQYRNAAQDVNLTFGNLSAILYYDGKLVSPTNTWEDYELVELFYNAELNRFNAKKYYESDPVFKASPASSITLDNIDNWDSKSQVSGTSNSNNWTTITINGTTKNIPANSEGTKNYNELSNKPSINGHELSQNLTAGELDLLNILSQGDNAGDNIQIKYVDGKPTINVVGVPTDISVYDLIDTEKTVATIKIDNATYRIKAPFTKVIQESQIPTNPNYNTVYLVQGNNSNVTKIIIAGLIYNILPEVDGTVKKGDVLTANDQSGYEWKSPSIGEESDPVFTASPAHNITADNITSWNNKYSALVCTESGVPSTQDMKTVYLVRKSTTSDHINKIVTGYTSYNLLPSTQGQSGKVLTSQPDGDYTWSTPLLVTGTPSGDNWSKITIDGVTKNIPAENSGVSSYEDLDDKPKINGVTVSDNMSSSLLKLHDAKVMHMDDIPDPPPHYTIHFGYDNNHSILKIAINGLIYHVLPEMDATVHAGDILTVNDQKNGYEWKTPQGTKGTLDYRDLTNKPKINDHELNRDFSALDLDLQPMLNDGVNSGNNIEIRWINHNPVIHVINVPTSTTIRSMEIDESSNILTINNVEYKLTLA